jgi:hypothetical protein
MHLFALAAASGILPGCVEKLRPESAGGVQFALPGWSQAGGSSDAANGRVERTDGMGSRAFIAWDVDARPGPVDEGAARDAARLEKAEVTRASVAGHEAVLLRGSKGAEIVWRCERTSRLFRLGSEGPRSPEIASLAAQVRCHGDRVIANGDVPAAAVSALGPEWRFGGRSRGSISWLREDAVLTFFAGQAPPPPRDAQAARRAAPAWVAAAGLSDAAAQDAQAAGGPQSHPGIQVRGTARLEGRPVRWTLLFWRCLQRQRSFAAIVFSQGEPDAGALLAARCHG